MYISHIEHKHAVKGSNLPTATKEKGSRQWEGDGGAKWGKRERENIELFFFPPKVSSSHKRSDWSLVHSSGLIRVACVTQSSQNMTISLFLHSLSIWSAPHSKATLVFKHCVHSYWPPCYRCKVTDRSCTVCVGNPLVLHQWSQEAANSMLLAGYLCLVKYSQSSSVVVFKNFSSIAVSDPLVPEQRTLTQYHHVMSHYSAQNNPPPK